MVDLLVDTEFIKIGKNKYMNKLSNGIIYSEAELKELLRKNNKEVQERYKVLNEEAKPEEEVDNAIKPKTIQSNKRYRGKRQARN